MTMNKVIEVKGKQYKSTPEIVSGGCSLCALHVKDKGCIVSFSMDGIVDSCSRNKTIFTLDEKRYTVEEVMNVYFSVQYKEAFLSQTDLIRAITKELERLTDPEYQEYLKLKTKFGE